MPNVFTLHAYMSRIGSRGGKKSRRVLTKEQSRAMLMARESKRREKRIRKLQEERRGKEVETGLSAVPVSRGDFWNVIQ